MAEEFRKSYFSDIGKQYTCFDYGLFIFNERFKDSAALPKRFNWSEELDIVFKIGPWLEMGGSGEPQHKGVPSTSQVQLREVIL